MDASNGNNQANRGRGRQRINMERMENENNLQVTFSKRRAGLFKKANELSTLCGAESAVVVFSPSGKAHSFGHPNVESITNRFLATNEPPAWDPHHALIQQQRNLELVSLEGQVELEKQRKKELEKTRKESGVPPRVQDLSYEQLEELKRSILDFKNQFESKLDQGFTSHVGSSNAVIDQASSSTSAPAASYDPTFGDIFGQFMFPNLDDHFAVPGVGGAQENGANPDEAPVEPQPDFQGFNNGGFGGYSG